MALSLMQTNDIPIERLRTNSLELVSLFPPSAPTSIFKTKTVGNFVLLLRHGTP